MLLAGVAALGVACGGRTEGGTDASDDATSLSSDASKAGDVTATDATDGAADDATAADATGDEKALSDVAEECAPLGGACTTDSDCCDTFCGFGDKCGGVAPPYGAPPPP